MKRAAAIDVGSNSVRLLVAQVDGTGIKQLYKTLRTTRLGAGVDKSGVLSPEAIETTLCVLQDFKEKAASMGADDVLAAATSAVRDASNGEEFIRKVRRFGIKARVLNGKQEAELGFVGAVLGCRTGSGGVFLADIGGGSTELVLGRGLKMQRHVSLDIGAVRLTERFVKSDPPDLAEISEIEHFVTDILTRNAKDITAGDSKMIGVGGTITSLAAIARGLERYDANRVHNFVLTLNTVRDILGKLAAVDIWRRREIKGLQPERADIITAGTIILKCLMEYWGFEKITVSEWDNLEGIIYHNFGRFH